MIVVFGGTAEGREIAQSLLDEGREVLSVVTTEYARSLLPPSLPCRVGALDEDGITGLLSALGPERVIDATHPYAALATRNIRAACARLGVPLTRVEREPGEDAWKDAVEWAASAEEAAQRLCRTEGPVLLTTGMKTLACYASAVPAERLWARVLPTRAALDACQACGIPASHILAMQGPFSEALNDALLVHTNARVLVTKDSGARGGVSEKIIPALRRGVHVIVIRRPDAL